MLIKKHSNRGATLLEILIAMAVGVVTIGLSSAMFAKTYRIEKIACNECRLHRSASRIMDMIIFGERDGSLGGLVGMTAVDVISQADRSYCSDPNSGTIIGFYRDGTEIYRCDDQTAIPAPTTNLDYSNEVDITALSFRYFGPDVDAGDGDGNLYEVIDEEGTMSEVTEILIELSVKSTTGSIERTVTLRSSVSPRNLPQKLPQDVF